MTTPQPSPPAAARAVRILHAILTGGVVIATVMLGGVARVVNIRPIIPVPLVGYILTAVSVAVMTFATVVLRPRIPARSREQSTESFWSDTATRGAALAVWALCEASGMIGAVGYFVTGLPAALVGTAVALVALVWFRPAALEQIE